MKIFLDMDGVIVNFVDAFLNEFDLKNPYSNGQNCHKSLTDIYDVDRKISHNLSIDFWVNMEWTYNGKEILATLEEKYGPKNIYILSSPGKFKYAPTGKMEWIRQHMPDYDKRTLLGRCKYACAGPDKMLVDDTTYIIKEFRNAGGSGFLVPRPWNYLWEQENKTIELLKQL